MADTIGNAYSVTGWYKPTYSNKAPSEYRFGENNRPDKYTKDELITHYDFVFNDPNSFMRPDQPLPEDSDQLRYDWVFNVYSGEGRWQLHNPNGLNADRHGYSPYDWESGGITTVRSTKTQKSENTGSVQVASVQPKQSFSEVLGAVAEAKATSLQKVSLVGGSETTQQPRETVSVPQAVSVSTSSRVQDASTQLAELAGQNEPVQTASTFSSALHSVQQAQQLLMNLAQSQLDEYWKYRLEAQAI